MASYTSIYESTDFSVYVPVNTLFHVYDGHMRFSKWRGAEKKSFLFVRDFEELASLLKQACQSGTYTRVLNKEKTRSNIRIVTHFNDPVGLTGEGILCHLLAIVVREDDMAIRTILPTPCCCKSPKFYKKLNFLMNPLKNFAAQSCRQKHYKTTPCGPCYKLHTDKNCSKCGKEQVLPSYSTAKFKNNAGNFIGKYIHY